MKSLCLNYRILFNTLQRQNIIINNELKYGTKIILKYLKYKNFKSLNNHL